MSLANELATLESAFENMRAENKILTEARLVMEFEINQLTHRLKQSETRCGILIARESRLKTLLDHVGAGLVAGISKYNEETKQQQHMMQEDQLVIGSSRKEVAHG